MTGELNASLSEYDEATCQTSHGSTESIDSVIHPGRIVMGVEVRVGNLTEGQTGDGFPGAVAITADDQSRFTTSLTGCTASISEHRLDETVMPLGPGERGYQVTGTASCSEKALNTSGIGEGITLSGLVFRTSAFWRD